MRSICPGTAHKASASQPTCQTDGGSVGRDTDEADADPKPCGQDKERLQRWRAEFQAQVQNAAADKGIVFAVPLPDSVFKYIEDLAKRSDLESAQNAVLEWLDARNFDGLNNPNAVWAKMPAEMVAYAENAITD
jgi:hypothetical protein